MFPNCKICTFLLDEYASVTRAQCQIMEDLDDALQRNRVQKVQTLARDLIAAREFRDEAVRQLRQHLMESHEQRIMTAK
jgi:hypothetical protein